MLTPKGNGAVSWWRRRKSGSSDAGGRMKTAWDLLFRLRSAEEAMQMPPSRAEVQAMVLAFEQTAARLEGLGEAEKAGDVLDVFLPSFLERAEVAPVWAAHKELEAAAAREVGGEAKQAALPEPTSGSRTSPGAPASQVPTDGSPTPEECPCPSSLAEAVQEMGIEAAGAAEAAPRASAGERPAADRRACSPSVGQESASEAGASEAELEAAAAAAEPEPEAWPAPLPPSPLPPSPEQCEESLVANRRRCSLSAARAAGAIDAEAARRDGVGATA